MAQIDFTMGQHDSAITQLLADSAEMRADINVIKAILSERRGGRQVGLWVITTFSGVLGAIIALMGRVLVTKTGS